MPPESAVTVEGEVEPPLSVTVAPAVIEAGVIRPLMAYVGPVGDTPVALRLMLSFEGDASEVTEIVPVVDPATLGEAWMVSETLCPTAMLRGRLGCCTTEKPAPLT